MIVYLIKSTSCLALFYLFYKLFLEKENMHVFKRFYLLGALLASFSIPLVAFTNYVSVGPIQDLVLLDQNLAVIADDDIHIPTNYLSIILWITYGFGVILCGLKFTVNISKIIIKIRKNPHSKTTSFVHVLLEDLAIPNTFFKYIFLDKYKFESKQIPQEVIIHEQTHATQLHSLDILLIELVQVVFWFNPLIYFMKHAIKLNHEFLADQAVLNKGTDTSAYQNILLNFSSKNQQLSLVNAINYSFIKKRFTIMKTQTSKRTIWFRVFLILPLVVLLFFSFSNKVLVNQDKATPEQVVEYNNLAKKYNDMSTQKFIVKYKEVKRLKYIYGLMNETQKKNAEPFPNFPAPPPAPMAPTTEKVYKGQNSDIPPPPPTPPNPLDHMIALAKKGATFYYEDDKISSDKAIAILKKNKSINIQVLNHDSKSPVVKLSKKPFMGSKNKSQGKPSAQSKWNVSAVPNNKPIIFPKDADFYINDKKATYSEFKKLDRKSIKRTLFKKDENKVYITTH